MADKRKIVIEVDDSRFKKYTEEEKKATNEANEREKRKTAQLRAELDRRYLDVKSAYAKELQAQKTGDELKIKQAVKERIAKTRELNLYEIEVKKTNRLLVEDTKQAHRLEILSFKNKIKEMSSAPRTNLRGTIGSEAYVRQLQGARTTMLPTSPEFAQTTALINRYKDTLKQSGIEVKSLAQNIRGELTSALSSSAGAFIGVAGAVKLFNMSLESARFETLKANFQGTTADIELFRKATSGTVDDASLIKLSNQATDLGVGLDKQAILFSLAEDAADKYGTSVEEGFQKVVFATEGNTKGLKMLGIQKGQFEELVKSMTESLQREGVVIDADTEKQIRLDAILKLSGKTIDDVKNKVQDSADKHEQFIVIVKNLSLAYGGDLFNAVTGVGTAYRVVTEIASKLNTVIDIQKNIIMSSVSAWQNLTSQIPIVGDAISWLADRYRDLAGAQSQTAEKTFVDAGADFIEAFDPNQTPSKTRQGGNANALKRSGTKGSGFSKIVEETQQELNLVKQLEAELVKQNAILDANRGDIGAERQIRADILEIEKQIYRYRTGIVNDNKFKMTSPVDQLRQWNSTFSPKGVGINPRALNDPRGDMSSEEIDKLLNGMEISFDDVRGYASQTSQFFESILSNAGLTDSAFGRILSAVNQVLNTGGSLFGMFDTFLSFIPGGSVAGGAIGAVAGGFNPMNSGMPTNNMRVINNQPIIIQGTLNGQKFLKKELRKYNVNKGAVTL